MNQSLNSITENLKTIIKQKTEMDAEFHLEIEKFLDEILGKQILFIFPSKTGFVLGKVCKTYYEDSLHPINIYLQDAFSFMKVGKNSPEILIYSEELYHLYYNIEYIINNTTIIPMYMREIILNKFTSFIDEIIKRFEC